MHAGSLLVAARYTGLRPGMPRMAWKALTYHPSAPAHSTFQRGLKVLAFKDSTPTHATSLDTKHAAPFGSAAAGVLKTPIPYAELTIGKLSHPHLAPQNHAFRP